MYKAKTHSKLVKNKPHSCTSLKTGHFSGSIYTIKKGLQMYDRLKRLKDNKTRGILNEDLFFEPGEINIERSKLKDMGFISKKTGLFKPTLMGLPKGTQFEVKHIYEEDGLVLVNFLLYIGVYFQTTIEPDRLHFNMIDRR